MLSWCSWISGFGLHHMHSGGVRNVEGEERAAVFNNSLTRGNVHLSSPKQLPCCKAKWGEDACRLSTCSQNALRS